MTFATIALQGQVAIITGGGTGIGKGIAQEMAKAGAEIVILNAITPGGVPTL